MIQSLTMTRMEDSFMRQLKETRQRLISVSNLFICRGEQHKGVAFFNQAALLWPQTASN